MSTNRYIKSVSNYTLRKKHQITSKGTIYERDWMTISESDGYAPDSIPVYGESNFKFVLNSGVSRKRKRSRGNWVQNDACAGSPDVWTINCLPKNQKQSDENKVILKPMYHSLGDFAYYGSAVELIRASIDDIIKRFPAELYFSDTIVTIGGNEYYKVDNELGIDVTTKYLPNVSVKNPLRYICLSTDDYYVVVPRLNVIAANCIADFSPAIKGKSCYDGNNTYDVGSVLLTKKMTNKAGQSVPDIVVRVFVVGGEKVLVYDKNDNLVGTRIRPKENVVEDFFESLDRFQSILLNRKSAPLFRADFDTPHENEFGFYTTRESYVFPTVNDWNLDISSTAYMEYLARLQRMAEWYDEYDSDNIWRSMTHEAMKTLDWTFVRESNDGVIEETQEVGTPKLEAILKLYGRQYDDIKGYIDNIARMNTVTYGQEGNVPNYMLSDTVAIKGFEPKSVHPTTDLDVKTHSLYKGVSDGYDSAEINAEFMRRLSINAPYLLREKGTRKGVLDMLGLFGFGKDEVIVEEYVAVASDKKIAGAELVEKVKKYNSLKSDIDQFKDDLQGIPVKEVITSAGENYLIPWFDKKEKYDGAPYFQMMGGWGKQPWKNINLDFCGNVKVLQATKGFSIYDETENRMQYASTIAGMLSLSHKVIEEGDVCFVDSISDFNEKYEYSDTEDQTLTPSNYFVLKSKALSTHAGFNKNDENQDYNGFGWKNVPAEELQLLYTDDAKRVAYMSQVMDDTSGNNPHIGKNKYDDGKSYLDIFDHLFANSEKEGLMAEVNEGDKEEMLSLGFNVEASVKDNRKVHYFNDEYGEDSGLVPVAEGKGGIYDASSENYAFIGDGNGYNFESGQRNLEKSFDEASANSIINVKNLKITFKPVFGDNGFNSMAKYINNVVMFYVKQMIPSTTILEWEIDVTPITGVLQ